MASRPGSALERIRIAQRARSHVDGAADEPEMAAGGQLTRRSLLQGAGATALALGLGAAWPAAAAAKGDSEARVVIVGAGIAGLGCAHRLWQRHGIRADVYEWSDRTGGRIQTLRGYFDDGQLVEEHAEFINPEHTATLHLARSCGSRLTTPSAIRRGSTRTRSRSGSMGGWSPSAPSTATGASSAMRSSSRRRPRPAGRRRTATAPRGPASGIRCRSPSGWTRISQVARRATSVGSASRRFSTSTAGPRRTQSSLNLIDLLGADSSTRSGLQARSAPELDGGNEKWHLHGGNDLLISGIIDRLPEGLRASRSAVGRAARSFRRAGRL